MSTFRDSRSNTTRSRQSHGSQRKSLPRESYQRQRASYGDSGYSGSEAQISPIDLSPRVSMADDNYLNRDLLGGEDEEDVGYQPAPPRESERQPEPVSPVAIPRPATAAVPEATTLHDNKRLVIGIDYGTTYTGIAFATPKDYNIALGDVEVIRNFGIRMGNHDKIPSVKSYSYDSSGQYEQWGSDLSPNAVAMMNTKLELDVQETKLDELQSILRALQGMRNLSLQHLKDCNGRPQYTSKSAQEVATDYLSKIFAVFDRWIKKEDRVLGSLMRKSIPVDIVVTIPAKWTYQARNATYHAIKGAGFNEQTFQKLNSIVMVSEPEAAALHVVKSMRDEYQQHFLKPGQIFVLCDAGGGTVDAIAYRVLQVEPLELQQIGNAACIKRGSTYINLSFKKWLRENLGERYWPRLDSSSINGRLDPYAVEGPALRTIMELFEASKKQFDGQNRADISIRLPSIVDLDDVHIPGFLESADLTITQDQMQQFLDTCVSDIVKLIEDQVDQAEIALKKRVRNLITIGGFSESKYLQYELGMSMDLRGIQVTRPDDSWVSVVKGAVLHGIRGSDPRYTTSASPRHLGIVLRDEYPYVLDFAEARDMIANSGHLQWLIGRGDLMFAAEPRIATHECNFLFSARTHRKFKYEIFTYDEDDSPPKHFAKAANELTFVMHVNVDMSTIRLEEMYRVNRSGDICYQAKVLCKMVLKGELLQVEMYHNRTRVAFDTKDLTQVRAQNPFNPFRVANGHGPQDLYNNRDFSYR